MEPDDFLRQKPPDKNYDRVWWDAYPMPWPPDPATFDSAAYRAWRRMREWLRSNAKIFDV